MLTRLSAGFVLVSALSSPSAWAVDSPVAAAALDGDKAAVRTLIQSGADVNGTLSDGTTALDNGTLARVGNFG